MINKKNITAIVVSVLFISFALVYFLVNIESIDVPGNYKDFKTKSVLAADLNNQKLESSNKLLELRKLAKTKEDELLEVKETADKSNELFEELLLKQEESGDWSFHIPSLLIELEKNADDRNIKLAMDYESFNSPGEFVSSSGKGLQVVTAKVDIFGEYHNVNKYIKSLEDIDFISVEDLKLSRVGSGDLVGTYYLNIYYLDR
jgi:hypothetical protein